jgi:hypothetical protein
MSIATRHKCGRLLASHFFLAANDRSKFAKPTCFLNRCCASVRCRTVVKLDLVVNLRCYFSHPSAVPSGRRFLAKTDKYRPGNRQRTALPKPSRLVASLKMRKASELILGKVEQFLDAREERL